MMQIRIAAALVLLALAARAEGVDDSITTYVDLVEHAKTARLEKHVADLEQLAGDQALAIKYLKKSQGLEQ